MKCISYILTLALILVVGIATAAESEVSIACEWGNIAATLAEPDTECSTAVVIVAGSGPTDRNGNSGYNLNTYTYKLLSDELVARGYAVLRYDKRGVGQSAMAPEGYADLIFDDFVDDAASCVAFLRDRGFERVVVAGHSEGGLIALELASREGSGVDGLVLLATAGYGIDKILLRQLSAQLMPTYIGLMLRATDIINTLKRGERVAQEQIPQELISLFHPNVQSFLISQMQDDPCELAGRCGSPMLIISGGRDIQVAVDNGEALLSAAPNAQHILFERMSHVLKDSASEERMEQFVEVYTNPSLPLTEGLVDSIAEFLTCNIIN